MSGRRIVLVGEMKERKVKKAPPTRFIELKRVFKTLHGPDGCLWDKRQTHNTLVPQLKEEVEELIAAIRNNDPLNIKEELGDILLHVMFNAQIASKENTFDIEDVIDDLIKKIKRRHPHVFGKVKVGSEREIILNWNKIKLLEKTKYGKAGIQKNKDR